MTLVRDQGRVELVCDACDTPWPEVLPEPDYEILLADARAAGWRASRIEAEWRHRCAACAKANRPIPGTTPDPTAGLFGQALPIKRKPR